MPRGLFIAIEGIDGAGTTTHAKLLFDSMRAKGLPVHLTREPSDGPIGVMIRQMLSGRLIVPSAQGPCAPDWKTMALLFAADRLDHIAAGIDSYLVNGVNVITDRYDYSSVAYQSLTADNFEEAVEWVKTLNIYAKRPDLTIVLDVSADVAAERRKRRGGKKELYEEEKLQERLANFYHRIDQYFPNDRIFHVNSDHSIEDVSQRILALVEIRSVR